MNFTHGFIISIRNYQQNMYSSEIKIYPKQKEPTLVASFTHVSLTIVLFIISLSPPPNIVIAWAPCRAHFTIVPMSPSCPGLLRHDHVATPSLHFSLTDVSACLLTHKVMSPSLSPHCRTVVVVPVQLLVCAFFYSIFTFTYSWKYFL